MKRNTVLIIFSILLAAVMSACASAGTMTITTQSGVKNNSSYNKNGVTITYIGDSIASGYGLKNPQSERYSALIKSRAENSGMKCTEHNLAVSGTDSTELLDALKNGSITIDKKTDFVVISIGANNVMGSAMNFFKDNMSAFITKSDTSGNIDKAYNQFVDNVVKGIEKFKDDVPEIIKEIRADTDAQIIIQTVYNPFKNSKLSLFASGNTINLSDLAEGYITMINDIIISRSTAYVYEVADVHKAFEKSDKQLVNADTVKTILGVGLDPHPNIEGHKLIADTVYMTAFN